MDRAADARSVAIRVNAQLLVVRSRLEVWRGGSVGRQGIRKCTRADLVRKSLAEWCRRALGGELPPRAARPCHCSQRAAPEAAPCRVRLLPSRGPHAPWTGQGNAGVPNSLRNL